MLSVYTNQQELLKATSEANVSRIESVDADLLKLDFEQYSVTFEDKKPIPDLELHVYTPDGLYLTGNHRVKHFSVEKNDTTSNLVALQHIAINIPKALSELGLTRGQYKVVYNLFDNVLGKPSELNSNLSSAADPTKLWIKEISPSRRELRLQLSDNDNPGLTKQLEDFEKRWESLSADDRFDSFVLNFGFNETFQIVNIRFETKLTETPEVIIKLYNPLPGKYGEKAKVWISEEIINPVIDSIILVSKVEQEVVNKLRPANFEIEEFEASSIATDFKTWNDLLSTNVKTSQQIIDSQFSGSLSGIKLNVNYRIFDNFVHYGSAVERVKNFKYKLELIEQYSDRVTGLLKSADKIVVQSNLNDLYTKRNRVVSGFDDFEKYLFFESTGSKLYTHYDEITGSRTIEPVDPWPKTVPTSLTWVDAYQLWSTMATQWKVGNPPDPYQYFSIQESTTSNAAITYFNNLLEIAETYDKNNVHKLQSTIPYHIQTNEGNEEFLLFIHMLGQHFDILWAYINHLSRIKTREEHPKDGMSDELLYHVASSLGFELLNGRSSAELWKYVLGTDEFGDVLKNGQGLVTLSDKQITNEIWRRIVNNLPYILKTKGTSRSIKALLNCFGIPLTVLTIKEYGGPSTFTADDHYPEYIHDVFHYAWFSNSATGSLKLDVGQYTNGDYQTVAPNSLVFRFKADNNYDYFQNNYYNVLSISSGSVNDVYNLTLSKESAFDNEGTLTLFNRVTGLTATASNLEIFDNSWHLVSIESTNATASLKVVKSLYGNTIYVKSASFYGETLFPTTSTNSISFASGSRTFTSAATLNGNLLTSMSKFYGHFQEVRLWSGSVADKTLGEHAASPNTYTYNRDLDALTTGEESAKPYEHLLQRFTLSSKKVFSGSFYQPTGHPNQTLNTGSIYFIGYLNSGSITFEGFEETYYTPSPSLGGSSLYANKIRIESSSLDPNRRLNTKTRIEKSSLDLFSVDSNRVGVYFSPQTGINEDIFNQIGYFEIDDYIGDPREDYETSYTVLNNFAENYWKKYSNRNDFEAYFRALEIYDFTVFKYIKRLLPERVNAITGLVVENNVLNRSKVKFLRNKPALQDLVKNASLQAAYYETSGEYHFIETAFDKEYFIPAGEIKSIKALIENIAPTLKSDVKDIKGTLDFVSEDPEAQVIIVNTARIDRTLPPPTADAIVQRVGEIQKKAAIAVGDILDIDKGVIENSINTDRLGTTWLEKKITGRFIYTVTGSFNPIGRQVYASRPSTYKKTQVLFYSSDTSASLNLPNSASLVFAEVNNEHGQGYENLRYAGSKLTGPGINVDTSNTVDGGPVVKITRVNPNQIVFANNQITTIDENTTGNRKRRI